MPGRRERGRQLRGRRVLHRGPHGVRRVLLRQLAQRRRRRLFRPRGGRRRGLQQRRRAAVARDGLPGRERVHRLRLPALGRGRQRGQRHAPGRGAGGRRRLRGHHQLHGVRRGHGPHADPRVRVPELRLGRAGEQHLGQEVRPGHARRLPGRGGHVRVPDPVRRPVPAAEGHRGELRRRGVLGGGLHGGGVGAAEQLEPSRAGGGLACAL
mmetsp:Transcript_35051/g.57720  ORF Transcript_35051/g.57720 Transcript_35051/m.57720 type:complete len:210 (-) Transcript_35051:1929-2558(-)